jgi:hypothetical protein
MLFLACSKDDKNEETNNLLEGNWTAFSWTLDGDEQLGGILASSFKMEYTSESTTGGKSKWTVINGNGFVTTINRDYTIKNDGKTLSLEGLEFAITFNGDEVKLSGIVQGQDYIVEATKD